MPGNITGHHVAAVEEAEDMTGVLDCVLMLTQGLIPTVPVLVCGEGKEVEEAAVVVVAGKEEEEVHVCMAPHCPTALRATEPIISAPPACTSTQQPGLKRLGVMEWLGVMAVEVSGLRLRLVV